MNCIFCKIINNECPSRIAYEDAHTIVFMDIATIRSAFSFPSDSAKEGRQHQCMAEF